MDLFSFRCFIEVADELSFTQAAEKLFVSQQVLSAHIKKLETEYGVVLLERKPRVSLTYAGRLFLENARQLVELEDQIRSQMSYVTDNCCGIIRLGINSARIQGLISLTAPVFYGEYPNVTLSLAEANSAELAVRLLNGDLDLVIGIQPRDHKARDPRLRYLPLIRERLFYVVSDPMLKRFYPELSGEALAKSGAYMRELMDIPLVMSPEKSRIQSEVNRLFLQEGRKPNQLIISTRGSALLPLCRKDLCAVFLPEMILMDCRENNAPILDGLHVIPLLDESLLSSSCIILRKGEKSAKHVQGFMDITARLFRADPAEQTDC